MPSLALTFFKFATTSIAQGFLGGAGNLAIGGIISAIFGGEDLDQKQVQELQKINASLLGIRDDLKTLDSDLETIEETLERILGEEKLQTWLAKANTIAGALAHIETDFQNYIEYTTPLSNGQLPTIPKSALKELAYRAYEAPVMNDEQAMTEIRQALIGSGAGDGLLHLFARLLIERLGKIPRDQLSSEDLSVVCHALVNYYLRSLAFQQNAIILVIEGKRLNGFDNKVLEEEWNDFQASLKTQQSVFLETLWGLISVWRLSFGNNIYSSAPFNVDSYIWSASAPGIFSNNDLLAFLPGITSANAFGDAVNWYKQHYDTVLKSPEQTYLADAEMVLAAFTLTTETARRVVIHVLFYIGYGLTGSKISGVFNKPIPLSGINSAGTVDVHITPVPKQNWQFGWIRHVFDLDHDGGYKMANVNSEFPTWQGYADHAQYKFQSDADLALSATVDSDNPVGIIRFSPYIQAK